MKSSHSRTRSDKCVCPMKGYSWSAQGICRHTTLSIKNMKIEKIMETMKAYTPFQRAVWLACMAIPRGQTRSYKWIAERIGHPKAARAVGTALGKNPFAPVGRIVGHRPCHGTYAGIVPCHRVIKSDGTPGGFSAPGGSKAKIELLKKEK